MKRWRMLYWIGFGLALLAAGCGDDDDDDITEPGDPGREFTLRIENVSGDFEGGATEREGKAFTFSPGVYTVAVTSGILFETSAPDRGEGLESLAEDGDPSELVTTLRDERGIEETGIFDTPAGGQTPGPIGPGQIYEFTFDAEPGEFLNFASMLIQTNDVVISPSEEGVPLFDPEGDPLFGDISGILQFLDVGTEINEAPGEGMYQPMASDPGTGPTEGVVQPVQDGFTYPEVDAMLNVDISSVPTETGADFTMRIENVSGGLDLGWPIAPGVFAVDDGGNPVFESGEPDPRQGLEPLAEDGDPDLLAATLEAMTEVASGIFDTPDGEAAPGPAGPGQAYEFGFTAQPGDRVIFATMLIDTNDLFFAPANPDGIALFDGDDPIEMDVTMDVALWDAGTEINEEPHVGEHQPQQAGPDSGPTEGVVQPLDDGYEYPSVGDVVRATLEVK